jgi:predicted lipoprotein with Yx(FWY)xxD motif
MTLYLFTEDPPGDSVCLDDCLAVWPPLLIDGEPRVGDGVDSSLVGTIERPDDGVQLTYDDAPLYLWASDQQPGEVTGQGVQEVWFVVSADGSAVTDTEAGDDVPDGGQETRPDY